MPAAAGGLTSSSRQRRARLERQPSVRKQESRRNLVRQSTQRDVALTTSLTSILERSKDRGHGDSSSSAFNLSMASNPELFVNDHDEHSEDGRYSKIEMRQRSRPQNAERRISSASSGKSRHDRKRRGKDKKDSFIEDDVTGSPPSSNKGHPWLDTIRNTWWFKYFDNLRNVMGRIVNSDRVQNFVLLLIVINAIMMGIATFPIVKENPEISSRFEIVDLVFLIIFTIESGLQLLYHGWNIVKDGFLVFDLLIVVMSWALEGTQVIRAFRVFRALRLITRIDTLKNLVLALFSVVPKMAAIFMLLMLIFYIFGVMFTQLYKDMYDEGLVDDKYFSGLGYSFFTLFQMMTLDEWASIQFQIAETRPWSWLPFLIFIVITGFVVVNLMIAVICDAVHVMGNQGKSGLTGMSDSDSEQNASEANRREHIEMSQTLQLPTVMESYTLDDNKRIYNSVKRKKYQTDRRLEELQQQLDEMVRLQDQMRKTIEVLTMTLRENLARENAST